MDSFLVAVFQSFIFAMLSNIYVSEVKDITNSLVYLE